MQDFPCITHTCMTILLAEGNLGTGINARRDITGW
jgi:hypothetical protein